MGSKACIMALTFSFEAECKPQDRCQTEAGEGGGQVVCEHCTSLSAATNARRLVGMHVLHSACSDSQCPARLADLKV